MQSENKRFFPKYTAIVSGVLTVAISGVMNLFLIPADVYASGFTGVAQLLSSALDQYSPIYFSTGTLLFILNIPVGILGWLKVGRSFTVYSILSVALTTVFSPSPTLYLPGMEMPPTFRVKVLSVLLKVQVMAPGFTPILARYSSALDSIPEVTAEPARLEMMPPSELVTETAIPL